MPRLKLWLVLTAMLALIAFGLTGGTVSAQGEAVTTEDQVLALVNAERAAAGLPPVVANPTLSKAAQGYAEYMARENFFSHKGLDGSTLVSRAEAAGYVTWSFLAENLAAGQQTPEKLVAAWMKSPSHRANILSEEGVEVGFGRAYNPGSKYRIYWAMEMGPRVGEGNDERW
jgi:uncharacterized protein YkwD